MARCPSHQLMGNDNELKGDVILETVKFTMRQYMDGYALKSMKMQTVTDEFCKRFGIQLKTFILGEKVNEINEKVTFEVPQSAWQFFKWQYFPQWLLKYFPVKNKIWNKTVTFKQIQCFPKIKSILPPEEQAYEFTSFSILTDGNSPFKSNDY